MFLGKAKHLKFYVAFATNFFTAHLFQPFQFCSLWCNFLNPCAVSSVTFSTLLLLTVYSVTRSNFYNLTVQFLATLSGVQCVTLYLTQYCPFAVYLLRHFQCSFLPKSLLQKKTVFFVKLSTCSLSYKNVFNSQACTKQMESR